MEYWFGTETKAIYVKKSLVQDVYSFQINKNFTKMHPTF